VLLGRALSIPFRSIAPVRGNGAPLIERGRDLMPEASARAGSTRAIASKPVRTLHPSDTTTEASVLAKGLEGSARHPSTPNHVPPLLGP